MIFINKFFKRSMFLIFLFYSASCFSSFNPNVNGVVHYDSIKWIGDNCDDFIPGVFLKDISLSINGYINNDINYIINFNVSNYKNKNNLSEVYINYFYDTFVLKFGQFIPIFSFEEATLLKNKVFIENSLIKCNLFENFYGFTFNSVFEKYNLFASMITPEMQYFKKKARDIECSLSFRFFRKFEFLDFIIHAGMNYSVINTFDDRDVSIENFSFRDIPMFISSHGLLMTHPASLPRYQITGFEFMSNYKSLNIQSELRYIHAIWKDYDSEIYKSFYFQLSYFLTGEKRNYNFKNGATENPLFDSKFGALELALRYNYVNMFNEGALLMGVSRTDGRKHSFIFGLNWFVNNNFKIQLNYSYEDYKYRNINNRWVSAIGLRTQLEF